MFERYNVCKCRDCKPNLLLNKKKHRRNKCQTSVWIFFIKVQLLFQFSLGQKNSINNGVQKNIHTAVVSFHLLDKLHLVLMGFTMVSQRKVFFRHPTCIWCIYRKTYHKFLGSTEYFMRQSRPNSVVWFNDNWRRHFSVNGLTSLLSGMAVRFS